MSILIIVLFAMGLTLLVRAQAVRCATWRPFSVWWRTTLGLTAVVASALAASILLALA